MSEPNIFLLDDLASEALQAAVWQACSTANWQFGHGSTPEAAGIPFWYMSLDHNVPVSELWTLAQPQCEELVGHKLEVVRQYANGHTFGQGGQPHRDSDRDGAYTLLYYPMPEWERRWEGETNYFDDQDNVIGVVPPAPNRGVLFDARLLHFGRAPNRHFAGLRVTVAYKLQQAS